MLICKPLSHKGYLIQVYVGSISVAWFLIKSWVLLQ